MGFRSDKLLQKLFSKRLMREDYLSCKQDTENFYPKTTWTANGKMSCQLLLNTKLYLHGL